MANPIQPSTSLYATGNTINELIKATVDQANALNNKLNINGTAEDSRKLGGVAASLYALKTDVGSPALAQDSLKLGGKTAIMYSLKSELPALVTANRTLESEVVSSGLSVTFTYDADKPLNKELKINADTEITFDNPPVGLVLPSSIVLIEAENTAKVTLNNVNWMVEPPDVTGKPKYAMILNMTRIGNKWYVTNVTTEEVT